jgi:hypothetical protein
MKSKVLFWLPRVLGLIYIGFLVIFALDVFVPGQTTGYYIIALFMHLIPNFVLALLLIIAWKYERFGGALFALAFLTLFAMFWNRSYVWMQLLLFSPLLLISFLFLFHTNKKTEEKND